MTLKKNFLRILPDKIQNTVRKDDFRRFSVIWEFSVTGNWVEAHVVSRVKMGL